VGRVRVGVRPFAEERFACSSCRQCADGSFVELVVEDDGHGMGPEVIERIFEPFFSTKETGKGSGMGLAMVHGIVHEHGGHVVVESSPGTGARFRIVWPAVSDTLEVPRGETPGETRLRPPRPQLRGSVLVVDDEETVREFMRELLESWGIHATCTPTAVAALDLVRGEPGRFDVVITDQSMPKVTGLELARRLRQLRSDLPVVLYTGNGEGLPGDEVDAARLCALMLKPIDPTLLSQTLARCLASTSPGPA
jgi:CheY-like chemotaxis protein